MSGLRGSLANAFVAAKSAQQMKDIRSLAEYSAKWLDSAFWWHRQGEVWRSLGRVENVEMCGRESDTCRLISSILLARIGELAPSSEAA